jgi:hypothetical protein
VLFFSRLSKFSCITQAKRHALPGDHASSLETEVHADPEEGLGVLLHLIITPADSLMGGDILGT